MGQIHTKLFAKRNIRILLLGLDHAGKTSMLHKMKLGEIQIIVPTIGYSVETVEYKNVTITNLVVGGGNYQISASYRHYYPNTDAIIFMVDCNDCDRLEEAKNQLRGLLGEKELRNCPLIIMANKQDLPNAISESHLSEALDLHSFRTRNWYVQATCVDTGEGLYEAFDWLSNEYRKNQAGVTVGSVVSDCWRYTCDSARRTTKWIWG